MQDTEKRIEEISKMPDENLLASFQACVEWSYAALRDMRDELAKNLFQDRQLLEEEILRRMKSRALR